MGGFCPGGFVQGDFVPGDFVRGGLSGGILSWNRFFKAGSLGAICVIRLCVIVLSSKQ